MKKIEYLKWDDEVEYVEESSGEIKKKLIPSNSGKLIKNLMMNGFSQSKENGWEQTRVVNRVGKALDKAEKDGFILLEEGDYSKLKKFVDSYTNPLWGFNEGIMNAIEAIQNPEDVKMDVK